MQHDRRFSIAFRSVIPCGWTLRLAAYISPGELSPGTYTLEARLRKADGSWSAIATVGHFSIPAPLWQRTWFVVLAILCLLLFSVGIIWLIQRRKWKGKIARMKREEELQEMRLRISRDIHDDIGSGLSRIVLMNQLRQPGEDVFSQRISETARDLTRQLGHIVWSLNPENDKLTSTWYYLRQECGRYFEGTSVELQFEDNELPDDVVLDPQQRANTIRIFREAMNNALKYSESSRIDISCAYTNGRVQFRIADNGKGFAPGEIQGNGNGLRNFARRIEELHGELKVVSSPGNGVEIAFSFHVQQSTT
jgi:signal transduction histidine kinase